MAHLAAVTLVCLGGTLGSAVNPFPHRHCCCSGALSMAGLPLASGSLCGCSSWQEGRALWPRRLTSPGQSSSSTSENNTVNNHQDIQIQLCMSLWTDRTKKEKKRNNDEKKVGKKALMQTSVFQPQKIPTHSTAKPLASFCSARWNYLNGVRTLKIGTDSKI